MDEIGREDTCLRATGKGAVNCYLGGETWGLPPCPSRFVCFLNARGFLVHYEMGTAQLRGIHHELSRHMVPFIGAWSSERCLGQPGR